MLDQLEVPIVQAPLAGGPSTPELAAAVCNAGGLGFVAGGYRTPEGLAEALARTRTLTDRRFGVNLFAPTGTPAEPELVRRYAEALRPLAERAGVALGEPRFDDDGFDAKLALLLENPPGVVSFTFGCPPAETIARVRGAGSAVWVTVTDPDEAEEAVAAGADAVVVQGVEAGGHRGSFVDRADRVDYGLLALLALVRARVGVPLVATGGIATGRGVAAVLTAGAAAAQIGTAFMRAPEAGTSPPHREALGSARPTGLTRAFSGRLARGIVNRFQAEHSAAAPLAYPEVHHVTAPLRAHGRKAGDADVINLWAGQAHALAEERPAAEIVARLAEEARAAAAQVAERLGAAAAR
ncbi:MAG: nitronate monooxygenase [Solirubrobacteraceae bacterium]|nr:nitronate monooxygenase [Solirubrobacteraceae bacterium]